MTTALAVSALMAAALAAPSAEKMIAEAKGEQIRRTAHERPAEKPAKELHREFLALVAERADQDLVRAPSESPDFTRWELLALEARHERDKSLDSGPPLRSARTKDRLLRADKQTYLLFGSARHLSAFFASA